MAHDSTKVVMGSSENSAKEIGNYKNAIEAGLVVRLKSDGTISVDGADGSLLGVSMGKDLSDTNRSAVCRKGVRVPVKIASGFTPTIGAQVAIVTATGVARAYTGTGDAYVNAVYSSSELVGLGEDGNDKEVALIDFPGGL